MEYDEEPVSYQEVIAKLVTKDFEAEVKLFKLNDAFIVNKEGVLRMSVIRDSLIIKTNPGKIVKYNENYVSRTKNNSDLIQIKDSTLFINGVEHQKIEEISLNKLILKSIINNN